jgi:hypothetical protein
LPSLRLLLSLLPRSDFIKPAWLLLEVLTDGSES